MLDPKNVCFWRLADKHIASQRSSGTMIRYLVFLTSVPMVLPDLVFLDIFLKMYSLILAIFGNFRVEIWCKVLPEIILAPNKQKKVKKSQKSPKFLNLEMTN